MDGLFHRELRRILKVDDFWYPKKWETSRPCHFLGGWKYTFDELSVFRIYVEGCGGYVGKDY